MFPSFLEKYLSSIDLASLGSKRNLTVTFSHVTSIKCKLPSLHFSLSSSTKKPQFQFFLNCLPIDLLHASFRYVFLSACFSGLLNTPGRTDGRAPSFRRPFSNLQVFYTCRPVHRTFLLASYDPLAFVGSFVHLVGVCSSGSELLFVI